jgi:hypothetical protein
VGENAEAHVTKSMGVPSENVPPVIVTLATATALASCVTANAAPPNTPAISWLNLISGNIVSLLVQ